MAPVQVERRRKKEGVWARLGRPQSPTNYRGGQDSRRQGRAKWRERREESRDCLDARLLVDSSTRLSGLLLSAPGCLPAWPRLPSGYILESAERGREFSCHPDMCQDCCSSSLLLD